MHPSETHQRFIELRAKGWSLVRISAELQVGKSALAEWHQQHADEIDRLRRFELEAQIEKLCPAREEELARIANQLNRIEAVIAQRNVDGLTTSTLFRLAGSLRNQLRKQLVLPVIDSKPTPQLQPPATPSLSDPLPAAPADSPSVQSPTP